MAEVAGVSPERIWDVVYASGLFLRRETRELSDADRIAYLQAKLAATTALRNSAPTCSTPAPPRCRLTATTAARSRPPRPCAARCAAGLARDDVKPGPRHSARQAALQMLPGGIQETGGDFLGSDFEQ